MIIDVRTLFIIDAVDDSSNISKLHFNELFVVVSVIKTENHLNLNSIVSSSHTKLSNLHSMSTF